MIGLVLAYGPHAAQAASGTRTGGTPDQELMLAACVVGMVVFTLVAILDIVKWIEDERKRKKTGKAGPGSD